MKILYHANCPDGYTAAWVAYRALAGANEKVEMIPVQYGQPPPWAALKEDSAPIYIVDFSYSREEILALQAVAERVVIIDHHKTAKAALEGLGDCVFDMDKSGAMLTWEYFHPCDPVPRLVQYVQDRDLWKWELLFSKEISAYIQSLEHTLSGWDDLYRRLEGELSETVAIGAGILRFVDTRAKIQLENARVSRCAGKTVPFINTGGQGSETLHFALEKWPEVPFVVGYFDRADGKRQYELRSRGDFDVSEVAKYYGGGGHKRAAGFTLMAPLLIEEHGPIILEKES